MKTDQQVRRYLKDYQPHPFSIERTDLQFFLGEDDTRVLSKLQLRRQGGDDSVALTLDGVDLELVELQMDGRRLLENEYEVTPESLTITSVPDRFELRCEVKIDPAANTRLEGLYLSNGNFCTQCEAEGFRHITYYIDRPDVMSVFSTEVHAPKTGFPVLLSNGNCVDSGENEVEHWVRWEDPYPKPSYLFALVAGDLACIEGEFTTVSQRKVKLRIYTEHHNREKCGHALQSLQKAMQWDEEVYGLEYDLDLFMIVAVDDFNMGAMENKGLNVFNTRYVLANSLTATDDDYLAIEAVIAHEYFHNWTGNRVTCRDWFQLSLKEGLTVFRDQEFSADMTSRAIQRIGDVRVLRNHQFPEDAGPMSHPIRPASYQEINNFYTATVYNKGAEVVRMIHCLLGRENFRKGMDLYFERHDGQAVTTDDFRLAMEDASAIDLQQFQRWYEQSGTPRIDIKREYDAESQSLALRITQQAGRTRGEDNLSFHMPMRIALFDPLGQPITLDGEGNFEQIVDIRDPETLLRYEKVPQQAMVSAFRGFSAPVILQTDLLDEELARLMVCDSDSFNRWEAGQQLASRVMLKMLQLDEDKWQACLQPLLESFGKMLAASSPDRALLAEMMVLPGEKYIAEMLEPVDIHRIRSVREFAKLEIAAAHEQLILHHYQNSADSGTYQVNPDAVARRRLKNTCLSYLMQSGKDEYLEKCRAQFDSANNMTEQMGCLLAVVHHRHSIRDQIVSRFYDQWQDTALVVDKWFATLGSSYIENSLEAIRPMFDHPAYSLRNPNRARSLLGAMIANSSAFHQADGEGYRFAAEKILALDAINPQVAARLANAFVHWRKLVPQQSGLMKRQIETMLASSGLSSDLSELLTTSLAG